MSLKRDISLSDMIKVSTNRVFSLLVRASQGQAMIGPGSDKNHAHFVSLNKEGCTLYMNEKMIIEI